MITNCIHHSIPAKAGCSILQQKSIVLLSFFGKLGTSRHNGFFNTFGGQYLRKSRQKSIDFVY